MALPQFYLNMETVNLCEPEDLVAVITEQKKLKSKLKELQRQEKFNEIYPVKRQINNLRIEISEMQASLRIRKQFIAYYLHYYGKIETAYDDDNYGQTNSEVSIARSYGIESLY